jgi:toxin ParE1/3/4
VRIAWAKRATRDLQAAFVYWCSEKSLSAGEAMLDRMFAAVEMLKGFPESGRPGRISGTRWLAVPRTPFVLAYRKQGGSIQILAVLHGTRKWPESL